MGILSLCLCFWGTLEHPRAALTRPPESHFRVWCGEPLAGVAQRLEQDGQLVGAWPTAALPRGRVFERKEGIASVLHSGLLRQEGQRAAHCSVWPGHEAGRLSTGGREPASCDRGAPATVPCGHKSFVNLTPCSQLLGLDLWKGGRRERTPPPLFSTLCLTGRLPECSPGPRPRVPTSVHTGRTPGLSTARFPCWGPGTSSRHDLCGVERPGCHSLPLPGPAAWDLRSSPSQPRPRPTPAPTPLRPARPTSGLFPVLPSLRAQRRNRGHVEGWAALRVLPARLGQISPRQGQGSLLSQGMSPQFPSPGPQDAPCCPAALPETQDRSHTGPGHTERHQQTGLGKLRSREGHPKNERRKE